MASWEFVFGAATATGTVLATGVAAWAVADARYARRQELQARLANAIYSPLLRQTRITKANPIAEPWGPLVEWNQIAEREPTLILSADPKCVGLLRMLDEVRASHPGIDRKAYAAAQRAAVEAATKVDQGFEESRSIIFEVHCEDGNLGAIRLRDAWASTFPLEILVAGMAKPSGYEQLSLRFRNEKGRECIDQAMARMLFELGSKAFRTSLVGQEYVRMTTEARSLTDKLNLLLREKLEPSGFLRRVSPASS